MKKTLGIGISAGVIAGIMTELSGPIQMISWVFFIGMLSFFASGCGVEGLKKSIATNISGVFWGWVILMLSELLPIPFSLGISVVLIVIVMCLQSHISILNFIPGAFVGCSCYFGTGFDAKGVLYALVVGNVLAWISSVLGEKLGYLLEGRNENAESEKAS